RTTHCHTPGPWLVGARIGDPRRMRRLYRPGRSVMAVAMTLAALVALAAQPASAAEPQPRYRLVGHGTDHGVGFSQRGASGRARAGQTYDQILLHYFDSRTTY